MRKMASIQRIREILPHNNADALEIVMVNDWQVVVKKGEFTKDQLVVYFEIDSWIPHEIAAFLSNGKEPREYEGVKGERLRTIKLRKELSQGLILATEDIDYMVDVGGDVFSFNAVDFEEGDDMSEILNVKKWEPTIPACLRGRVKGNFPTEIPKTDQERIQNLSKYFDRIKEQEWEITEKLHGSSFSAILDMDGNFHVCSRNLDLQYEENNSYWKVALNYNLEEKMQKHNLQGYAIQGELVGEGVNGNQYGIKGLDLYVFDIYSVKDNRYLSPSERIDIVNTLQLKHVPVVSRGTKIQVDSIQELLKLVDGKKSSINGSNIEGWVFKTEDMCYDDRDVKSFKVISNTWLLKNE